MKRGNLRELLQKNQDQFFVNLLDCSTVIHKQIPEAPKSDNCETLNLELMPKWKSDNTTILKNNSDTLVKILNLFSTRLKKLSEEAFDDIYQNSESFFPTEWKLARVTPDLK